MAHFLKSERIMKPPLEISERSMRRAGEGEFSIRAELPASHSGIAKKKWPNHPERLVGPLFFLIVEELS